MTTRPQSLLQITLFLLILLWSAIRPHDYFTWFLEVIPALLGFAILVSIRKRFVFTPLAVWLMLLHAIILMVGGHYTYAEVPLFDWVKDAFHLARNNYDKVGHFMQGFVPAIIVREILIRQSPLKPGKWLFFLVTCVCLAISACYELFEWWVAVGTGEAAEAFLGTQGYVWDTQSDMAWALAGGIISQILLAQWHNRLVRSRCNTLRSEMLRGFSCSSS